MIFTASLLRTGKWNIPACRKHDNHVRRLAGINKELLTRPKVQKGSRQKMEIGTTPSNNTETLLESAGKKLEKPRLS